ncbi:DUF6441 family protein [Caulobacter sp. UNC279MFTsu5.1]|uniref:DUF6441 family protein n=1 Tax=Caulobacter sp. UNC279MFTsu5.1 TaxID=1502775 RepID=UPI0003A481C0|nr:DUF6441 family protein [Caulobacter sp. UNC279MFTsu5.1]SFK41656.1 hypothetical protein SAMN02799626_04236 [Caulobacter sp. UNC279MFTsu5.1]
MRMSASADFDYATTALEDELAEITTAAMVEGTALLKRDLRENVEAAGLGRRLALTWRSRVYPEGGRSSLDPAGWVWTKAPKLIEVYEDGAMIRPTGGRHYLAIPSKNVPLKGRGRRMTPLDVEVAFNQDLIIRRGREPGTWTAWINAVAARNRRGFKPATRGRLRGGRQSQLVFMFTLKPWVNVRKRLNGRQIAERASNRMPELLTKHWR